MVRCWNGFELRETGGMNFQELFRRAWWAMVVTLLVAGALTVLSGCEAWAGQIREKDAVAAIVGEAAGTCSRRMTRCEGMEAVAYALLNRGTLSGVYGLGAPHVKTEPAWVWTLAHRAWATASRQRCHDVTRGATHWESTDFARPKWTRNMVRTVKIGKHVFYREKNR